jgi:hypothetical protein
MLEAIRGLFQSSIQPGTRSKIHSSQTFFLFKIMIVSYILLATERTSVPNQHAIKQISLIF